MHTHTKTRIITLLAAGMISLAATSLLSNETTEYSPAAAFETECADCHELADFEGITKEESVEVLMESVQGNIKSMKGLTLTPEEIDAMSAYIATQ